MKLFTLLGLLAACMLATTGVCQEVTKDGIKYDMDELGTNFGIKVKAVKMLEPPKTEGDTLITMTLEFTKDVPPEARGVRGRTLGTLRSLFAGKEGSFLGKSSGVRPLSPVLLKCYFFDEAGVAFTKQPPGKIEGELSGKEGDAFRITQSVPDAVLAKTRKISFREEPAPGKKK